MSEQCHVELSMIDNVTAHDTRASRKKALSRRTLLRLAHSKYILRALTGGVSGNASTYASQSWIIYWTLQSADLLGISAVLHQKCPPARIASFLHRCLCHHTISVDGASVVLTGFAGGTLGQIPHVATSYAACCALSMLGDVHYLQQLPRAAIKRWLLHLRREDGSFCVHVGGEADIRASYCAAVIVTLLQLDDPSTFCRSACGREDYHADVRDVPVLTRQTALFVAGCQNHEGGFGCSINGSEAHGAYTFCGLASLLLMRHPQLLRTADVRRWLSARQLRFEGGFNGRTNKLVDSCYSFWVGAAHALLTTAEAYRKLLANDTDVSSHGDNGSRHDTQTDTPRTEGDELGAAKSTPAERTVSPLCGKEERSDCIDCGCRDDESPCLSAHGEVRRDTPPRPSASSSDPGSSSSSPTVLRAREVLMLDYAQLIHVHDITVTDTTAWDAEERRYAEMDHLVQQFLDCRDACYDDAAAQRTRRAALRAQLTEVHRCCKRVPPSSSSVSDEDDYEDVEEKDCDEGDGVGARADSWAAMDEVSEHVRRTEGDAVCGAQEGGPCDGGKPSLLPHASPLEAHEEVPDSSSLGAAATVHSSSAPVMGDFLFDQRRVQEYVLRHCQNTDPGERCGGLFDKPGCSVDGYHTCYSLSGVSVAQNCMHLVHAPSARSHASASPPTEARSGVTRVSGESAVTYVQRAFAMGYVPCAPRAGAETRGTGIASHRGARQTAKQKEGIEVRQRGATGKGEQGGRSRMPQDLYGVVYSTDITTPAAAYVSTLRSSNPIINIHSSHVRRALSAWGGKTSL